MTSGANPVDRTLVEAAFSHPAFAGAKRDNAPCLLLAIEPVRLVWANAAAKAFFDAWHDGEAAAWLDRSGQDLGRKTEELLRRPAASGPRLERVRFIHQFSSRMLTLLCGPMVTADGRPQLAVAALGLRHAAGQGSWLDAGTPPPRPDADAPSASAGPSRSSGGDRLRFVWKTDSLGQIVQADALPFRAIGAPVQPVIGTRLAETVRAFDPSGAERLAVLLAPSAAPVDIDLAWPASNGHATVPVSLKATPWFDADRAFAGFRGFGMVDPARLDLRSGLPPGPYPSPPDPVISDLQPDPSESERNSDDRLSRPLWTDGKSSPLANVVQLRPFANLRAPIDADGVHETPASSNDDLPPRDPEPATPSATPEAGHLSSSEQEAFQEIGRTLQSGNGVDLPWVGTQEASEFEAEDGDPLQHHAQAESRRNAMALVEATTAGLLVLRGPSVVFANPRALDLLGYATQADADAGLGAQLTQPPLLISDGDDHRIDLARRDGGVIRLDGRSHPVVWSGGAAELWTLSPADHRDPVSAAPLNPPADAALSLPLVDDTRDLLDAAGEALALVDRSGRILMLNRAGERLLGRTPKEAVGEEVVSLLTPDSRAAALGLLRDPDGGRASEQPCDVAVQRTDGTRLELAMRLSRIRDDRYAVAWRDRAAPRREPVSEPPGSDHDDRSRQPDLLATLSHQIRTPLNAIIGFAEVMMDERFGPLGNSRYKDYLKDVHTSGTEVMSLVNDLLDLSRIESGRHDLDVGAVDINRIIAESVAQVQPEAHRARVIVRTSFSPRQPMVMADDGAARQILANLLSNAVKFNEPGGQVIVSTTTSDNGTVLVRIRDTGIGMSDRDIETALEPFRQPEPSRQTEGTKLGLPLTKALIGANGASLSIRSRPGEGTMVEVTFQPAATPTRVPA